MKKVFLSLDDIDLGFLCEVKQGFQFVANEENMEKLLNEDAMIFFKLNKNGSKFFEEIPVPFANFLVSDERKDLFEKANILEEDGEFERLFKLANLNMMKINFKIHQ